MRKYDYSKLYGLIREKGQTQEHLAKMMGVSEATLNLKLNNVRVFRQDEIFDVCHILDIPLSDVANYFFRD